MLVASSILNFPRDVESKWPNSMLEARGGGGGAVTVLAGKTY